MDYILKEFRKNMFNCDTNLTDADKNCLMKAKRGIMCLLSLFLLVLVVFFTAKTINEFKSGSYIGKDLTSANTISVSGKGEAFAKPDIAKISVSVEKEASSVAEAQNQATAVINKVMEFARSAGIDDTKDIKTISYNIYPRYDYIEKQGQVFRGYVVSQSLEIKIRKLEDVGKILTGVVSAGANNVGGVSFSVDKEDDKKIEARQKAIDDAKKQAELLARELGVKIVRLVSFSESNNGGIYRMYSEKAMMSDGMGGGAPSPEIPTGENTITSNVNLVYEIK